MDLRHLRYFVAAAEGGHVGRAAARLHVSQPALSKQLADLERELGVRLLDRHPRGVRPTRAGVELLRHARALLADAARAVEHVRRAGAEAPTLRVGLIGFGEIGAGEALVRRALAAFRAAYPHVHVDLDARPFYHHAAAVREGRLDVGFHMGLEPDAAGVAAEPLDRDALAGVLLPAAHRLAGAAAVEPADLAQLPCVDFPPWCAPREHEDEYGRLAAAGWRGRLDLEVEHVGAMLSVVAAGGAWLQSIPWTEGAAPPPGVVYRPLAGGTGAARDLYALTRAGGAEGGPDGPDGRLTEVGARGPLRTSNALALKACALARMGVVLQARWMVGRELREGALVDLFPDHAASAADAPAFGASAEPAAWLVYPSRTYLLLKVRAFVDHCTAAFRGGPLGDVGGA